ncbi:hypothetical protein D3C87_1602300 [compost metagenome]
MEFDVLFANPTEQPMRSVVNIAGVSVPNSPPKEEIHKLAPPDEYDAAIPFALRAPTTIKNGEAFSASKFEFPTHSAVLEFLQFTKNSLPAAFT